MRGKEKCRALKEIRKQIADENDIPYVVSQCTHQGECKGTCPKCEAELKYLERELAIRQNLGKAVAVVGISLGVCSSLTACSNPLELASNAFEKVFHPDNDIAGDIEVNPEPLEGDMPAPEYDKDIPEEGVMPDPGMDYEGVLEYEPEN